MQRNLTAIEACPAHVDELADNLIAPAGFIDVYIQKLMQ
jgi:hypothetical protein